MFISKLNHWLDHYDPYAVQRIVLGKSLFTATFLVYAYWLFRPVNYMVYIAPILMASFYEIPSVNSRVKKENLLLFIFASIIIGSVTFYLVYPFRLMFFFYAVLFLAALYYFVADYFGQLKNVTMIILATLTIVLPTQPPANLQVAYDMVSSALVSMVTILFCLRIYPNHSLIIWRRAMYQFIACMEADIEVVIQNKPRVRLPEEVVHLSAVRSVRRMIPRREMRNTYRIATYVRNIQFAIDSIYYETTNEAFWLFVNKNLAQLRHHMKQLTQCQIPVTHPEINTPIQSYVWQYLQKTMKHWNQLCITARN